MVASQTGMIMPGCENFAPPSVPVYRGDVPGGGRELQQALEDAHEVYESPDATADLAGWIIAGELAAGQLGNARTLAGDARRRFPDNLRLAALEAVVAYRESNLDKADSILREILGSDSAHVIAHFNLGLLLCERGQRHEGHIHLERAKQLAAGRPVARRAAAMLCGR